MKVINTHISPEVSPPKDATAGDIVSRDNNGLPLSYTYSEKWDFSKERAVKAKGHSKVNFTHIPEGKRRAIQDVLKLIYDKNPTFSVGTLVAALGGLTRISECLGSHDWKTIDQDSVYREFKTALRHKSLAFHSVENVAATLNKLHDVGITSRIILNSKSFCEAHCCPSKINPKQAIAIPENIAQRIFKTSIDIVERYHPHRAAISQGYARYFDAVRAYKNKKGDIHGFSGNEGKRIKHEVPFDDFRLGGQAICGTQIQTACLLVLLGFSGVRISEGLEFNKDSYKEREYGDILIPTITGKISKTQEGGVPKQETWVTHPTVEKALELAYDLSQFARDHYQEKYAKETEVLEKVESAFLVLSVSQNKDGVIAGNHRRAFKNFIKAHNIVATEDDVNEFNLLNPLREGELKLGGYLSKISPHDFRRTFAVFLVRNKLGNLMTLKHQYKHLNVIMAQWYTNNYELAMALDLTIDSELKDIVNEANISVTTDALFEIYNSDTLSGGKGERIARERDQESYKGTIYMSREEIERQVRSGSVNVVEHPTGFCFKPDCSRICSSDRSSKTCQYEAITPEKAKSRIPVRERLIERFNALNDGRFYMANILTDIALKIETIEQSLAAHNIELTPFKSDIIANSIAFKEL